MGFPQELCRIFCKNYFKVYFQIVDDIYRRTLIWRDSVMHFFLPFFLTVFLQLYAINPSQEESFHAFRLSNGVAGLVCEHPLPPHEISIRVVCDKGPVPKVFTLDCSKENLDEIEGFLEFCHNKIDCSSDQVTVIAVGDCSKEEMCSLVETHFQHLSQQQTSLQKESITIHRIPDLAHVDVTFAYPAALERLQKEDIKKQWQIYFFQELVQCRLEQTLKESGGVWLKKRESHFLLPERFFYGKARCADANPLQVLEGFLKAIQQIKKAGFEEEEFAAIKAKVQKTFFSIPRKNPDSGTLATYYADQCILEMRYPSYAYFMATSLNLIAELSLSDIHDLLGDFLQDKLRYVELTIPSSLEIRKEEVQEILDLFEADSFMFHIEKGIPQTEGQQNLYELLFIKQYEADIIWEIIDTLANNNLVVLGLNAFHLEKQGKKIHHIHPLRFLGTIFSDPYLKACMKEIKTSDFKWNSFLDGLSERMDQEYEKDNLLPYVFHFSQAVKANPDQIRGYIQKRDWKGVVKYLIKCK